MRAHDDTSSRPVPARLKRRAEFLRVGKGRRWHGAAMTLQTEARISQAPEGDGGAPRYGFTLTKKVGNAVVRNRARRRLREAVRLTADLPAKAGHDYVIIGRIETIRLSFEALRVELTRGLVAVHERGRRRDHGRPAAGARTAEPEAAKLQTAETQNAKPSQAKPSKAKPPGRSAPERIRPAP